VPNTYSYANSDGDGNSNRHANRNSHRYVHANTHSYCDIYTNTDCNCYCNRELNRDCYANGNCNVNRKSNGDAYSYRHFHTDSHEHTNCNCNCNRDAYGDANLNPNCHAYSDSQDTSDAAAAPDSAPSPHPAAVASTAFRSIRANAVRKSQLGNVTPNNHQIAWLAAAATLKSLAAEFWRDLPRLCALPDRTQFNTYGKIKC
jgi:hypothetical protein